MEGRNDNLQNYAPAVLHSSLSFFPSALRSPVANATHQRERSFFMKKSKYEQQPIPEYYRWMNLDGYTPEEILRASHRKMIDTMQKDEEDEDYQISVKSEVKVKS